MSSRQKMTFCTFPGVCRPSNLITPFLLSIPCSRLDDVQAADAIDEVDETPIVDRDVVGGCALLPVRGRGQEMADFPGGEWVRDADQPHALREPRKGNHGPVQPLRRLMTTSHGR